MTDRLEHVVLNSLIETCRDGERGFRLAAEQVADAGLKSLFLECAAQRARFASELLPHAQRLGGTGATDGTTAAALHRGWMTLENRLRHDDQVVVHEVERGDAASLRVYVDALNGMVPPETRDLIQRQLDELEESHARIPARAAMRM